MTTLDLFSTGRAVLSPCGRYRYRLTRQLREEDKRMVVIMLNPSTADAVTNDHTITKLIGFATRLKMDSFEVVNLFALRSTDPAVLALHPTDRIGPENDRHIQEATEGAALVIVGWGANPTWGRDQEVLQQLQARKIKTFCWGTSKNGAPRHPLMLAYTTPLIPYGDHA